MTYAKRTDANHQPIVHAFRAAGWSVCHTFRLGDSAPDLFVSKLGRTIAVEIKTRLGKVSPGQADWLSSWQGESAVVRSVEDVMALVGGRHD